MDSEGSISSGGQPWTPTLAILSHELRTLSTSWLVRLWFVTTAVLTLLTVAGNWPGMPTALLISALLFPYLVFPWFLVVMLLGISPVTGSRLDALADGILSRPVTRYEYLLASWAARVVVVLAVFLGVTLPAVVLLAVADRPVPSDDVTLYGIVASIVVVCLVLSFLVSLGFFVGTLLRRPLLAAVVLIMVWFPINLILHTFALEEFSPISLSQSLPTLLQTPWRNNDLEEDRTMGEEDMQAMAEQAARFLSVLSGDMQTPRREPPGFFDRGDYKDFSLWRVLLGYGLPTLLAVGLAMLCFTVRDL